MTESVRSLARCFIESVLAQDGEEYSFESRVDRDDMALFHELVQGTLREFLFLEWVVEKYSTKSSHRNLKTLLCLSIYQLLFLDRVPDYAIYSEARKIAEELGASVAELKYLQGLLKSVEREKMFLIEKRTQSLRECLDGSSKETEFDLCVLNAPSGLVDSLTIVDEDKSISLNQRKLRARKRALFSLASMKEKLPLIGYRLPGTKLSSQYSELGNKLFPRALIFQAGEEFAQDLKEGQIRIQGLSSQFSCDYAAQKIIALGRDKKQPVRVLEMSTGKGGKLLGTLSALNYLCEKQNTSFPKIEWVAVDSSDVQLELLRKEALPWCKKYWPLVSVNSFRASWDGSEKNSELDRKFDLIWLDAPCTGFGTLAKLPQVALLRGTNAYEESLKMSYLQKDLIEAGVAYLNSGGHFIYSVCTLTRPETLEIMNFLKEMISSQSDFEKTLWPSSSSHEGVGLEGFYLAGVQKAE